MKRIFPEDLYLYESSYGSDQPTEQLFLFYFDSIVSKEVGRELYTPKLFDYLTENGFILDCKVIRNRKHDMQKDFVYVNKQKHIIIKASGMTERDANLFMVEFLYDIKKGELSTQLDFLEIKKFQRERKKGNISLVRSEMGHLDTQEYDLDIADMDLGLNYGEDFIKVHDVIIEKLNKPKGKGIILLHGDPGTGKTSYLKYLTKLVKEKDILFIPPSLAEALSEPSIIPFLMEHKDSILIIEDAERVIADREGSGSQAGVSNVLNITDGILGDCLNIQIVATFNMKRERIDQALLRKGRLIAEHKFEKLTLDGTNALLKSLGKDVISDKPMTLADIYNVEVELIKTKTTSKIGF
jgi:hypothetical protein